MPGVADLILSNAKITLDYAENLVKDIPPERFARFAEGRGGAVESNHPAFVYGHLCLYPAKVADMLGEEHPELAVPQGYQALFEFKSQCRDDPDGTIYPAKEELVSAFVERQRGIMAILAQQSDDKLLAPHPVEERRERFPLAGDAAAFVTCGHAMLHLGQLSAWRRFEGLGPTV